MHTLLQLFGRSPFAPLRHHMQQVATTVHLLPSLFEAIFNEDDKKAQEIATRIGELEHQADLTKDDIRAHLPKSLFLAIDRLQLLEILTLQDCIADTAEDIAVLATLRHLKPVAAFMSLLKNFVGKNIEAFDLADTIMKEMHDLLESSFAGLEADKVKALVNDLAYQEHEIDLLQRELLKALLNEEGKLTCGEFFLWQKIFEATGAISNLSEKLGHRVRTTLELN